MIVVGLDPGTATGFATWSPISRTLLRVESMAIHKAMDEVRQLHEGTKAIASESHTPLLVMFEDARLIRIPHGRMAKEEEDHGAGVREGVGSIKRDCSIWEDFLEDLGIPYKARKPMPKSTKWSAEKFEATTGWGARTNNHARDAGVIVFGLNLPMAEGIVRVWADDRQRRTTSTAKSFATVSKPARPRSRFYRTARGGLRIRS